jgi:integrase
MGTRVSEQEVPPVTVTTERTAGDKAAYGGGSVRERVPGVWSLRLCVDGRQFERTVGSRAEPASERAARRALLDLTEQLRDQAAAGRGSVRTLGQLLDEWLGHLPSRGRSPKTIHEHRREIDTRIRPRLGVIPLDRLSAKDLDDAYREWQAQGLSESSVHRHAAVISAALNQAVKWGWIDTSPAVRATVPPQRPKRKLITPSVEQVHRLIQVAQQTDPVMAAAVALAFVTGARRGELCALRWSDVDLGRGSVRIERSLAQAGSELIPKVTKTGGGRTVALDRAITILKRQQGWQRELSASAGSPLADDPYVLSDNANGGCPIEPNRITDRFRTLCRRADISSVRFHDLRHANITQLIAGGVDARTVSARAGHASTRMTLDRYAHALPPGDVAAANLIGSLLPDSN